MVRIGNRQLRFLEYLFGAPGVGASLATWAPLACARVSAAVRVMPLPEICAPAACARVSGVATVILAPPLPPVTETTTAVSWFAPLSMLMVWSAAKAYRAGDRDNGRAHIGGGARCGSACRANGRNRGGLLIGARIDRIVWPGSKAGHAGDFDVGRAGS